MIKRWQREELTVEQAIGQLLPWGRYLHDEIVQVQRLQTQSERQVAALQAQQERRTPS